MSHTTKIRRALQSRIGGNLPCAVSPGPVEFGRTMGGGATSRFHVTVYAGPDSEQARTILDELLAPEGGRSIKATLEEGGNLDGLVDDLRVSACSGYQHLKHAGIDVLGATWTVEILSS